MSIMRKTVELQGLAIWPIDTRYRASSEAYLNNFTQ